MAFGQVSGPPASARRVAELAALLEARGFDSFREARHPFGLTQRQAGGKFTTVEVDELIERLEADATEEAGEQATPPAGTAATQAELRAAERRRRRDEEAAVRLDADVMATELTNRGWCCIPPA
jgi:hypothetical protein